MTTPLVALDAREFLPGRQTGISRYLGTLVDRVRRHAPAWRLVLVGPPGCRAFEGIPSHTIGRRDGVLWDAYHLPRHLRAIGARVYLTPYLKFRPARRYAVIVVTCDATDVIPDLATAGGLRGRLLRAVRRVAARRATARITISDWSRHAITGLLRLPPASYRVVFPGIAVPPALPRDPAQARAILHLSNGKPHKNVARLLEAYAALPPALQAAHPLLLAGIHPGQRPRIEEEVRGRAPAGTVRIEGHVDEADLPGLYARAALFAFPSLEEGFGIPPLEAMAQGVPVVASTAWALPETLGDAALLVDPRDARQLRDALASLLTDTALRERLVERGHRRAAEFMPERTGAALVQVVDEVLAAEASR
jgi:alpha-1,3-rhamnosyl/mannosyltransferase